MRRLNSLLAQLAQEDAGSLLLRTGEPPKIEGEAIDDPLESDDVVQLLFEAGGSRYLETLGATPAVWTTRVPGIGAVKIVARKRGEAVEAELTLASRVAQPVIDKRPSRRPRNTIPPRTTERKTGESPTDRPQKTSRDREEGAPRSQRLTSPPPTRGTRRPSRQSESARRETAKIKQVRVEAPPVSERPPRKLTPPPAVAIVERPKPAPPVESPRIEARPEPARPPQQRAHSIELPFVPSRPLSELLASARIKRASDLHLIAGRPPHFRIAGELAPNGEIITADGLAKLIEPSVPARLRALLERNGSCDYALDLPRLGRFRVNVARQRTGYKACFRLIPSEVPTTAGLGLPPEIEKASKHHQGLIVITGPSGHGKTSTLAALVDHFNETTSHHIITVEDPIEHVHSRKRALVSQREVGTHTRSFASALKGSLREDPDILVVGELRDLETVRMALAASETGHLVLGTMSTPSAARTIERLLDLFPPADQAQVRTTLAGGLKLVVAQRLVPSVDRTARHVAVEILPGSIALWTLIREDKTFQIPSLMQRGRGAGITRLDDSLAELVRAQKVGLADAQRVAEAPDRLAERVMHGVGVEKPLSGSPDANPPKPPPPPKERVAAEDDEGPKGLFERAGALFRKNR